MKKPSYDYVGEVSVIAPMTPARSVYECDRCGALVRERGKELHDKDHARTDYTREIVDNLSQYA